MTWLSSLLGILVIPRFLGPDHYGFSATAATVVMVGTMFAGFGTTNLVTKEAARTPDAVRPLVLNAIAWRLVVWAAILAVSGPVIAVALGHGTLLTVLTLAAIGGTFPLVQSAMLAGLQGIERLGRTALIVSAVALAGNGVLVLLLMAGGGVVTMTAWLAITGAVSLVATALAFVRFTSGSWSFSITRIRSTAAASPPYLAWDLGLILYGSIDMVLLALLSDSSTVGNYAFAYRLIGIPVFASTIITMAVYPSLSANSGHDAEWFTKLATAACRGAFLVTVPMAVGLAVLADDAVEKLSGGEFDAAAVPVVVLAVHVPLAAIHTVLGMALFASDRQKRMAVLAWSAGGFTVGANLLAIPLSERLWGNPAIGAAGVTAATEVLMGIFIWRWAWRLIAVRELGGAMTRVLAAATVMGVAVLVALATVGFWAAIPVGAAVYGAASFAFGSVSSSELLRIRSQLGGRLGRGPSSVEA